ncbi:MAG TPA: hypothetical protein VFP50_04385 [Anaeromyxobacteraceae bacterium]|nr:hypothetical protein [Anaeromyxobacteraceae bacterium]
MRQTAIAAAILLAIPLCTAAGTEALPPAGAYGEIDTKLTTQTIRALASEVGEARDRAVAAVKAAPQRYAPPVLMVLSKILFDRGDKDEAAFWYYAGQLRGRSDANLCLDKSAAAALDELNRTFGPPINEHAFKDREKLTALVERVVTWDRETAHDYDRRWIALSGMQAVLASMGEGPAEAGAVSVPHERWDEVSEQTRRAYLEDFRKYVARRPAQ